MASHPASVGPFRRPGDEHGRAAALDAVGSADRVTDWRDLIREHFVALDIDTEPDPSFTGAVHSTLLGHLSVATVDSTRQDCRRTPGLTRVEPEPYLQVGLVARGRAVVAQDDRQARLGPGEFALYETDRPFTWHFEGPWRLLVFTWPRELIGLGLDTSRAATARAFGGDGLGAMVGRLLSDVVASPPALTPTGGERLAGELAELVGTVAGEELRRAEVLSPRGAADLRRRVADYVDAHLDDPDLGPESIARAHYVSARQVHRAFAEESTTVRTLVRARRLDRARRDLLDPRRAGLSITEVAMRSGFADLPGFSRAFRARYAESPSAFRQRGGI